MTSQPAARHAAATVSDRMVHIDAMRAIAALAVVVHHYFRGGSDGWSPLEPVATFAYRIIESVDLGRAAVLLFFIISGYVVARSVAGPPDHNVKRFALRRFCRLFPMYWVAVVLHVVWYGGYSAGDILQALPMVQVPGWPEVQIVSVAWTLTVEMVFYALCACLHVAGILGSPRGLAGAAGCFLLVALGGAMLRAFAGFSIPFEWPLFLSIMFLGALLRELEARGAVRAAQAFGFAVLVLLPAILAMSLLVFGDEAAHDKSWQRHFNAYAVAILSFLLLHHVMRLRGRVVAYLGRISYSIYLLHPVAGAVVLAAAAGFSLDAGGITALALVIAGTIAVAAITFHAVEAPAIAAGRLLDARLGGRPWRPGRDVEDARRIP